MTSPDELFTQAVQHHQAGRLADAESLYRRVISESPAHAPALHNLAVLILQRGDHSSAIPLFTRAIELSPANHVYHSSLGAARRRAGDLSAAVESFQTAVQLDPSYTEAHANLAATLAQLGRTDEAIAACEAALQLKPNSPQSHHTLGLLLLQVGRPAESIECFRSAIRLGAPSPANYAKLALALHVAGRSDEAAGAYRSAIQLDPLCVEAYEGLGTLGRERGRLDEAIAARHHAARLRPTSAESFNDLGNVYKDAARLDDAIACFRRAVELDPRSPAWHSNLIYTLHFQPQAEAHGLVKQEQQEWVRRHAAPLAPTLRPHDNDPTPDRRLRIGYVSPYLRDHVIGRNLLPLFRHHDHAQFEIVCYNDARQPDAITARIRAGADAWRDTATLSDDALADLIRSDRIDILLDLSQHLAGNRLPVFARKPAPVQLSFAGYPASAGLPTIDYRLSDPHLDPPNEQGGDSPDDPVLRLHHSFWCYDPIDADLPVNPLPALQSGHITFGCLNNFCKINPAVLELWSAVLRAVPNSRLLLLSAEGSHRAATASFLQSHGISPARLDFSPYLSRTDYLRLYHRIDLALDTFPYGGHTTSLDALWMGVPTLTLPGPTPLSRAGLCQLSNLSLPDFIAPSPAHFIQTAAHWANDLPALGALRSSLRPRMEQSPLTNAPAFARGIEAAYQTAWRNWCNIHHP